MYMMDFVLWFLLMGNAMTAAGYTYDPYTNGWTPPGAETQTDMRGYTTPGRLAPKACGMAHR